MDLSIKGLVTLIIELKKALIHNRFNEITLKISKAVFIPDKQAQLSGS